MSDRHEIAKRLRAFGPASLFPSELLVLVAGVRYHDDAEQLLKSMRGAQGLLGADRETLEVVGISPAGALRVVAAMELARRALQPAGRASIGSAEDVHKLVFPELAGEERECLVVLSLDHKHRLLGSDVVSVGSPTCTIVDPSMVFHFAIRRLARAVVVVHNHPSGEPTPSNEDRACTRRLASAGQFIGIPLLDHVVVAASGYASLAAEESLTGFVPRLFLK